MQEAFEENNKKMPSALRQKTYILAIYGGEKGIRTPETSFRSPARFRVECIQPDSAISPTLQAG